MNGVGDVIRCEHEVKYESVSVIITCYNLERYISDAIQSVIEQDYEGSFELLVVDDASNDSSAEIIHRYSSVEYLATPKNVGVLMATVWGLRRAKYDVTFFLDGDDTWRKDKLSACMKHFNADPRTGLVTHDLVYMDGKSRPLDKPSRPSQVFGDKTVVGEVVRNGILEHADYVWLGSAYAIRRSIVDAEGFCAWAERLPDPFNTYQDWPLAYWVASQPRVKTAYLPEKLFNYRLHGENYSGDAGSVQKVLRNLRRTFNTMVAIKDISDLAGLQDRARVITIGKLAYYEYLLELYSGKRAAATQKFFSSQVYLYKSTRGFLKEWARFIGIQVLGVKWFVRCTVLKK